MEKHDYKDTLNEIRYSEDEYAKQAAQQKDAEIAYEALAVSSSMGAYGQDETLAELMQLQLTQEVLYKTEENNGENADDGDKQ